MAGIQREAGNGYGFGQAGHVTTSFQSRCVTPDQSFDIMHDARMIGSYGVVMRGMNDIQNDTYAKDGLVTQRRTRPNVQYGVESQGSPAPRFDTGIWYNPVLFQPVKAIHPKTSITKSRGGTFYNPRQDAGRVANSQNTCLWIARLPDGCTLKDLFGALVGCGKIYSANISPADPFYDHPAANVTFWDISGADKLMAKVRQGLFTIKSVTPLVTKNRFRGTSQKQSHRSRVVVVGGPDTVVNRANLEGQIFEFAYELEDVITRVDHGWWLSLEYRFSSVGQAEDAVAAVRHFKERTDIHPMMQEDCNETKVRFGDDPCAKAN